MTTGVINIRGKEYLTVALRVQNFRGDHPLFGLATSVIDRDEKFVVMQATITDQTGRILATGHAEEYRASSQINKTSALENAETSAIGRALAAFGYGGTEFASANEVANAIHQQSNGGEGHSQNGAVSPPSTPVKGWREPDSIYSAPTKLHAALALHSAELRRLGEESSFDDLNDYLTSPEYSEFIRVAGKYAPHYLEGGPPLPEEYQGIFQLEQRAKDLIALRGNRAA